MSFLRKLFGSSSQPASDAGIYLQVRCKRCGSLIRVRIDSRNDLSQRDEDDNLFVRKTLVDDRCYSRIELEAVFSPKRQLLNCEINGGTLVAGEENTTTSTR
ncbi:MAG TPA: hypothetical protein DEF47_18925 [Herpetosiphon sp.]|uniref:Uncharacterized protein n=1 Tax=Herpetosiphon aurantiacus (strain ATCC 23779 / DSM 785 / 114-95) TaxID=316274 RepID=A9B1B8_HERA2|nr:hypothetical protein [Herpetosiphon sp.]ABX07305.1 conserved hypothetical protein [Herpetosiphon aurantiacus DSM 785]HBW51966.1 hypothetical protein [Herpetosiphon sp.]